VLLTGKDITLDDELKNTPRRVKDSLMELTKAMREPMDKNEMTAFPTTYKGMVVRKDIPFASLCAHHIIVYAGKVSIAYIPDKKKLGLSKIIRFVQHHTARLSSQEELTDLLADEFIKIVKPKGVMVVMSACHGCEGVRGVRVPNVPTVTASLRGLFMQQAVREEALMYMKE
jgi:GTP cyclohydrolase I